MIASMSGVGLFKTVSQYHVHILKAPSVQTAQGVTLVDGMALV